MKRYGSEALMVTHQQAEGLHRLGIISDAEMKEFDKDCLVEDLDPSVYSTSKDLCVHEN